MWLEISGVKAERRMNNKQEAVLVDLPRHDAIWIPCRYIIEVAGVNPKMIKLTDDYHDQLMDGILGELE